MTKWYSFTFCYNLRWLHLYWKVYTRAGYWCKYQDSLRFWFQFTNFWFDFSRYFIWFDIDSFGYQNQYMLILLEGEKKSLSKWSMNYTWNPISWYSTTILKAKINSWFLYKLKLLLTLLQLFFKLTIRFMVIEWCILASYTISFTTLWCLFCVVTSSKVKEMISSHATWTNGATLLCHATLKSIKTVFILSIF